MSTIMASKAKYTIKKISPKVVFKHDITEKSPQKYLRLWLVHYFPYNYV